MFENKPRFCYNKNSSDLHNPLGTELQIFLFLHIGEIKVSNRNCIKIYLDNVFGVILYVGGGVVDEYRNTDTNTNLTDIELADLEFANITEAERTDLENTNVEHMVIRREADRIALIRQESAARTPYEFEKLVSTYNRLDENRERRERYHEVDRPHERIHLGYTNGKIIPAPFGYRFWREILNGNFLDIIFDCPHEIQELTASKSIYELVGVLNEGQKEVLYYWEIRGWTPQRVAAFRGQTDRNILKVHATMTESLRYKQYMRLLPRYKEKLPLTTSQQRFMENNSDKYGEGKEKRKRRTKAEIQADREKQENSELPTQEGDEPHNE